MTMRIAILLFVCTISLAAQETAPFSAWCSAGFGASSFGEGDSHWSKSGNVGVGLSYSYFTVKYERRVNSEFTILSTEQQAKSHEFLVGVIINQSPIRVDVSTGIGSMQQITRGHSISTVLFDSNFQMLSSSGTCFPIEIEASIRSFGFIGFSFTAFTILSEFKPIAGAHLSILIGYL
jgi:hypothetical protein